MSVVKTDPPPRHGGAVMRARRLPARGRFRELLRENKQTRATKPAPSDHPRNDRLLLRRRPSPNLGTPTEGGAKNPKIRLPKTTVPLYGRHYRSELPSLFWKSNFIAVLLYWFCVIDNGMTFCRFFADAVSVRNVAIHMPPVGESEFLTLLAFVEHFRTEPNRRTELRPD